MEKITKSLIVRLNPTASTLIIILTPSGKKNLNNVALQGGLDPKVLLSSQQEIFNSAKKYLDLFRDFPYIFNLGHGLLRNRPG